MHQLIDRLLLLAKVEQPTFKLNREPIALLPLINSLIKDSMPKLQQRRLMMIELTVNHQPAATVIGNTILAHVEATTVYADSFWLLQALQNVLDNAIYFARNNVRIDINTSSEQTVTLTIFNDGKPLPNYALAKVFDRYFSLSHQSLDSTNNQDSPSSANATSNLPKKGTGLGLTLVKQVIEHHGGTVAIDNIEDNVNTNQAAGVLFSITLPLAKPLKV